MSLWELQLHEGVPAPSDHVLLPNLDWDCSSVVECWPRKPKSIVLIQHILSSPPTVELPVPFPPPHWCGENSHLPHEDSLGHACTLLSAEVPGKVKAGREGTDSQAGQVSVSTFVGEPWQETGTLQGMKLP